MPEVATVIHSTASGQFGGTEQNVAELVRALRARDILPVLVCVGAQVDQLSAIVGDVPVEVVRRAEFSDLPVRFWRDLLSRHHSGLVVRSKNCVGLASWRLDLAVRLRGCRYVSWEQHTAKPPGVDPSVPRRTDWIGSAKQALRFGVHFNAPHQTVAVSEAVRDALVKYYHCRSRNIDVVYPGVDFSDMWPDQLARNELRGLWGVPDTALLIGCFGRLAPHKNYDTVLRALARAKVVSPDTDIWCAIGGVGSDRERLEDIASTEGVQDRVVFAGWQPDRHRFLSALDVLALPSSDEGLGLVLIEGIACGALALASRVGGMPEVFGDLAHEYILEDSDPQRWALRFLQVATCDVSHRRSEWIRLDTQIRHRFDGSKQWDKMIRVVLGLAP